MKLLVIQEQANGSCNQKQLQKGYSKGKQVKLFAVMTIKEKALGGRNICMIILKQRNFSIQNPISELFLKVAKIANGLKNIKVWLP